MAAYAALVSVMHTIDQIQLHPSPPISLDQKQVESLTENITFLQDFLELYPHDLESRISHAAHAAEDLIESAIVDRIHGASTSNSEGNNRDLFKDLEQVIKDMDIIKKEAMEIKLKKDDKLTRQYSMAQVGSSRLPSSTHDNIMVGFDDYLTEIMDKLTGQQSKRLIIPIVGMGGIGKTTLARNVYVNPLIVEYFDICAWVTISQDYNVREILTEVLVSSSKHESRDNLNGMSEEELGENVYKCLWGRRYLIVMDDMWNIKAWDKLKFYLPNNNNGSRLLITTRLSKLAFHLMGSNGFEMKLLDEDKSWILFSQKVFGEEVCPPELEEIGKKIAKCCKGLPLSIAVIGGLLAKSERTRQYWEYIAKNLNPIVNLEDDACCLKILSMSYINLPIHLKPCFLYMGVFPEDKEIHVPTLIKLWVAEGFLKPISGKDLKVVARDYFNDLIDRNLILEHKSWSYSRQIKFCKIHDLLRDLCLREARKEKFFCVPKENSPDSLQCINTQRRIAVHPSTSNEEYSYQLLHGLQSSSIARSVIWNLRGHLPSLNCRLLRVLQDHSNYMPRMGPFQKDEYFIKDILQLVNLRCLTLNLRSNLISEFPSSMCLLWNLQTLILKGHNELVIAPSEIWQMSQLRHLRLLDLCLPDPPSVEEDKPVVVLRNLQTLRTIKNFKCGEDVVNRIPNIKQLGVHYEGPDEGSGRDSLINLGRLTKLESFYCTFDSIKMPFLQNITFPHSLKKLTLNGTSLDWEEMSITIGLLPLLQELMFHRNACKGPKWEPVEGQFCSLKFLRIYGCCDLAYWMADKTNFPRLEQLLLRDLRHLEEVPSGIGDIPTLRSIRLIYCSTSAVISVKKIVDEQEDLGNEDLQVQVYEYKSKGGFLYSLASRNFRVHIVPDKELN